MNFNVFTPLLYLYKMFLQQEKLFHPTQFELTYFLIAYLVHKNVSEQHDNRIVLLKRSSLKLNRHALHKCTWW